MAFNSLAFLVFFAVVFSLYQVPLGWTYKKTLLVLASLLFYSTWNPPLVFLLMFTVTLGFQLARWMERTESERVRRLWLYVGLASNLGVLGYFKYAEFVLENFVALLHAFGVEYRPAPLGVALPAGISFYTFKSISYLVDVYRRKIRAETSFVDYNLYMTFFPCLIAGPILRAGDFLVQCKTQRRPSSEQVGWGLSLLMIGLLEKMLLADLILPPIVDKVYARPELAGFVDSWIGTLAFSGQLLFDFAGYSTCAVGLAHCFGFVICENFRYPYAAVGVSEFWQRWHISLSTWLRDYIYFPLGGSRLGEVRTALNLAITMMLGGLWHGASWQFVAWGVVHGGLLIVERFYRRLRWGGKANRPTTNAHIPQMLATFAVVSLTRTLFRASDMRTAVRMVGLMLFGWTRPGYVQLVSPTEAAVVAGVVGAMLAWQWWMRDSSLEAVVEKLHWFVRSLLLSLMSLCLFFLILRMGESRAYIYFRF